MQISEILQGRLRRKHLNQPPRQGLVQWKWWAATCKIQRLAYPTRLRRFERWASLHFRSEQVFSCSYSTAKNHLFAGVSTSFQPRTSPVGECVPGPCGHSKFPTCEGRFRAPSTPAEQVGSVPLASLAGPPMTSVSAPFQPLTHKLSCPHLLPLITARATCKPFVSGRSRLGTPAPQ